MPVTKLQAGQEVVCECGQRQVAPTLRAIQKLPELEAAVSRQRLVKQPWSASRTSTFAAGLVVVARDQVGAVLQVDLRQVRIRVTRAYGAVDERDPEASRLGVAVQPAPPKAQVAAPGDVALVLDLVA